MTGALGSLGFRRCFGFGASVLVATLPFSKEIFGFLPGFFRSFTGGGAGAGAREEALTVMLEVECADASFVACCGDGEPGLDCGGEERSAELDREASPTPDWRRVAIIAVLYRWAVSPGSKWLG